MPTSSAPDHGRRRLPGPADAPPILDPDAPRVRGRHRVRISAAALLRERAARRGLLPRRVVPPGSV